MRSRMRHSVTLALIAVGVTAAVSFAQQAGPTDEPTPSPSGRPRAQEKHDGCGGGRKAEAQTKGRRPHRARPGSRVVHGELKVQRGDGFALRVLDAGTVTAVAPSSKTLTIKRADDDTITVTASDDTRICKNGSPADLADIETGDFARIMRVTVEGATTVKGIRAHSPETEQQEPAAAPASFLVPA